MEGLRRGRDYPSIIIEITEGEPAEDVSLIFNIYLNMYYIAVNKEDRIGL